MATFTLSLQKTLLHEGGYANDPNDTGGETYKGISCNAHPNWQGWTQIDICKHECNFPKNLDQNTKLQQLVEQFYHTNFWQPLNATQIENQAIADSIFDFAVNAGIKTSVRTAQEIIGSKADGILGQKTIEKLNTYNPEHFLSAFTIAKIKHYIACIKNRPTNKTYLYGWIIRTLDYC
jgi:lysozyme family protein